MQMKEQGRNSQGKINKEEIGKLPEKEFRVMIVKKIQNVKSGMEKMQESINIFNNELEKINIDTKMNNTIAEIKNTIEGSSSRITEEEEQISELEARIMEITSEE